jgi:hypothetical protein
MTLRSRGALCLTRCVVELQQVLLLPTRSSCSVSSREIGNLKRFTSKRNVNSKTPKAVARDWGTLQAFDGAGSCQSSANLIKNVLPFEHLWPHEVVFKLKAGAPLRWNVCFLIKNRSSGSQADFALAHNAQRKSNRGFRFFWQNRLKKSHSPRFHPAFDVLFKPLKGAIRRESHDSGGSSLLFVLIGSKTLRASSITSTGLGAEKFSGKAEEPFD